MSKTEIFPHDNKKTETNENQTEPTCLQITDAKMKLSRTKSERKY